MLALVAAIVLIEMLADKLRVAYPVLLGVAGLLISFIPGLPKVQVDPNMIFFIFAYQYNTEKRALQERDTYGKAFLQIMNLWEADEDVKKFTLAKRFAKIAADLLGVENVRFKKCSLECFPDCCIHFV